MKRAFVFSLFAFFLVQPSIAELKLDMERIPVNPQPEDETVQVEFSFKNTGNRPVTILSLESGCACLSASLDKRTYAPGEVGTGKAEFKVGSFVGEHEKIVRITTDDPEQTTWDVPFLLHVPEVVSIEPKNVQWWVGEDPSPKPILVKMTGEEAMKITNITSTRESVSFAWKEVKPGREYMVTVTPKTTEDVVIGALKIETDSKVQKYARQLAFFSIVRKPESRQDETKAGEKP